MAQRDLKVGAEVMAKWPGSDRYYEAVIQGESTRATFLVKFTDGEGYETKVHKDKVYKKEYFRQRSRSSSPARTVGRPRSRSPARTRSPARSRSPARTRSPARSRGRSRSPGRRSRHRKSASPPKTPRTSTMSITQQHEQETAAVTRQQTTSTAITNQTTAVTPSRKVGRPPKSARTPERKVEEVSLVTSSSRVTRSATKKLVSDEKEALLATGSEQLKEIKHQRSYEFGGPLVVFLMMLALPVAVLALNLLCNEGTSCTLKKMPKIPPLWAKDGAFFDCGHLIVNVWLAIQVLLYLLPIGKVVKGRVLADGTQLEYRMNGFLALIVSVAGFAALRYKKVPLEIVTRTFIGMITAGIVWSVLIAVALYIMARRQKTGLAPGGNTGNVVYDFFMGHQLNPRIGNFDLKYFFEVRPGLIGWVMLNFCMAALEYDREGSLSASMILVCTFQFVYVADCLWFESSILTTYDILDEGFGFMLAFGDIAWVPFAYSLQAHFILAHPVYLSWPAIVGIALLKVIGYVVFRGSNAQKDRFRMNPHAAEFRDAETILTVTGRRLLVSGWWGLVRHPNYLGDILMAISWSLTCGFTHIIPSLYPVYLACLLVHRELRDEEHNKRKYGRSWDEYCRRVPYRIIPKVF